MACPYFFPTEKTANIYWPFPSRLPLGAGFCGKCMAQRDEIEPGEAELRDMCNLGYARRCSRIPKERHGDAVRFAVARDGGTRIVLHYSCERDHAPVAYGRLEYDCSSGTWPAGHQERCIQRQAECYLATYLERRRK